MLRKVLIALFLLLAAAPGAGAAPSPQPLAPDAAANGPAAPHAGPVIRRITLAQALADGAAPGAAVDVAPGFSAAVVSPQAASLWCWTASVSQEWGYWPYDLHLADHTDWCGYLNGALTYRSTVVTESTTLCSPGSTSTYRLAGGVGYTWVEWEDQGNFSCPTTVPWVTYHYSKTMDMLANSSGEYVEISP